MIPIKRQPELLVPVKLMPGLGHLHLAVHPPALMLPDGIPYMRSDLCHPGSLDNVCDIRQGKMLAWRDHAEEVSTIEAGRRPSNGRDHVVVARRDIGDERPEQVERGMVGDLLDHPHIVAHLVKRHMSRPLDHPLYSLCLCLFCQCAERDVFDGLCEFLCIL